MYKDFNALFAYLWKYRPGEIINRATGITYALTYLDSRVILFRLGLYHAILAKSIKPEECRLIGAANEMFLHPVNCQDIEAISENSPKGPSLV